MSQTEDQLESGGGITDLVFDAERQERQSFGSFVIRDYLDQKWHILHKFL